MDVQREVASACNPQFRGAMPACERGCGFMAHSNMPFHPMWTEANKKKYGDGAARHCCHACMTGKKHGPACEKKPVPKAKPAKKKEGFTYDRMGNSIPNSAWFCPTKPENRTKVFNPED